jgi:hypothetical protein
MRRHLCFALCLTAATAINAQTVTFGPKPVTGQPLDITTERKTMQTLADGTHITRTTHETFYRDSQGRTLEKSDSYVGERAMSTYMVQDPAANQRIFWNTGAGFPKQYTVNKVSFAPSAPVVTPYTPAVRPTIKREDLGIQYVEGYACQSTRTTQTYPVDMIGNDRPITVVSESCQSKEFGRPLKSQSEDPRFGTTTSTVTSISREEPNPALFQPPSDYAEQITTTSTVTSAAAR